jgi:hypothetical protein
MHAIEQLALTLQVALFLLGALAAFGLARLFVLWMRSPVSSQREREGMFLAQQAALAHALRRKDGRGLLSLRDVA